MIKAYCDEVGIDFSPSMLSWESQDDQKKAIKAFDKWNGFHNDAIGSNSLKPRTKAHVSAFHSVQHGKSSNTNTSKQKSPTVERENEEWRAKFGEDAQKVIRQTVDANIPHYEYLKSFAIKV